MGRRAALLALALALRVVVAAAPPPSPEDDSGVPEAVAWSHPIGDPPLSRGSPRCRGRCVDDGEAAGAPLGGMGAGTLGRTYRGDFARWHLRPGTHTHAPAAHTFAAVRVDGLATVLSSLEAHRGWENDGDDAAGANRANRASTEPRRRVLPPDGSGGTYRALYPRSSYSYVPGAISARGDVALAQTQFSPVLPGRYREASLPAAVFRFTARNTGVGFSNATRAVSLMFQFENPARTREVAPRANGKTRLSDDAAAHAAFGRRDTSSKSSSRLNRKTTTTKTPGVPHKGAHMYTKRVVDGGPRASPSVSEPWHGGFAVAAAEAAGARVTVTPAVFSRAAAVNHWRAFEARGECVSYGDETPNTPNENARFDVPLNASLAYSAVCVSFTLAPGASREIVFSVAWDFPVASFETNDAAAASADPIRDRFATAFIKRYARYHPHGGEDVPLGAAAPALAAFALDKAADWEAAVRAWQQPYVDSALDAPADGGESNRARVRRPAWFVSALFNELHHLVDAGTLWGRPLGVTGVDGVAASFFRDEGHEGKEETARLGEDGEGGDAADVAGNGGVWGGSLGRFGLASNRDAPTYNAVPAYFFGSWALAEFWPGLDLSVVADLASAVRAEDDAERETRWAAERVAARRASENIQTAGAERSSGSGTTAAAGEPFVAVARKRRKVRGAAPHDLGDAREGPRFGRGPLRDSINAHDVSDVNAWLDLAPMLSLLVARAHVFRTRAGENGENDGTRSARSIGLPDAVLRALFEGAYASVSTLARTRDADGDGALEHVADPATHGPDHVFDRWAVAPGSKSAYCGSLWLAALRACAAIAASLGETRAAASLDAAGARAARALNDALWVEPPPAATGSRRVELDSNSRIANEPRVNEPRVFGKNGRLEKTAGYFRHDESGGALGNASSAAQVVGEWALATLGLAPAHPPARTREALETVLRVNARDGATFPANAADVGSFLMSDEISSLVTETHQRDAREAAVLGANLHSGERWPAFAYVVAAHAVLVTDAALATDASVSEATVTETETERDDADRALVRKAWASARAAYDATWTRGLAFRAPEAMDDEGRFRGAADLKNGAVWALDRALVQKAREAENRERQRKGRGEGDFLGSDVSETRDEL